MAAAIPRVANLQYRRVLETLDDAWAVRPGGACRKGCAACCYGPFDVGPGDVWLAVEAVGQLEPDARRRVMGAIATNSREERALFAGQTPTVEAGEAAFDRMCDALAHLPCPFLHDEACSIYDDRPQPCRLTGAGWGIGAVHLELECPIDLTTDEPRVALDVDGHELAVARHESRLPALPGGINRSTLASALDAVLRT